MHSKYTGASSSAPPLYWKTINKTCVSHATRTTRTRCAHRSTRPEQLQCAAASAPSRSGGLSDALHAPLGEGEAAMDAESERRCLGGALYRLGAGRLRVGRVARTRTRNDLLCFSHTFVS
jgi:hypothetical protein